MNPWLQARIEELQPVSAHVEHKRLAQEEVLQTKTGSHSAKVEEISAIGEKIQQTGMEGEREGERGGGGGGGGKGKKDRERGRQRGRGEGEERERQLIENRSRKGSHNTHLN